MPKFEAYYAGPETGLTYQRDPTKVTFWNLGKSHTFTVALEADTPDAAYEQLQVTNMNVQTARSFDQHASRLTMLPGDVLLQEGGIIHVRTQDGWLTSNVEDAPMR